jgi:hypothetical protein
MYLIYPMNLNYLMMLKYHLRQMIRSDLINHLYQMSR